MLRKGKEMIVKIENLIVDTDKISALLESWEISKRRGVGTEWTTKIHFNTTENPLCICKPYPTLGKVADIIGWKDIKEYVI